MDRPRRVAVTGLGVVSPLGVGREAFWRALTAGQSGVGRVSSFDPAAYRTQAGAEVKDFKPREIFAYALAAAKEALEDAKIDLPALDKKRAGIALGTTSGEAGLTEKDMDKHLKTRSLEDLTRDAFPHYPGSAPARLARELGFEGPNVMLTTACAAGNGALIYAYEKLRSGRADLMLAGGCDVFSRITFAGFSRLLALAPERCAPFSKGRQGLIPGEGCAVLVLEDLGSADRRGARIYAELLGYGLSSDAHHVTMPEAGGVARAIAACLKNSGLAPEDVGYLSAHGTGTPANDKTETAAIKAVFGPRAARVPVSSIKSMLGHAMGAASAFEAAASCLSLQTGVVAPTINFTGGDPDCDLDYVPDEARKADPKIVLSNAFAFGGGNAVVALGRPGARAEAPRPPRGDDARIAITGVGVVEETDPVALAEKMLPDKDTGHLDRGMALALCGVRRALDDAGLDAGRRGAEIGLVLDSSGELESLFRFYQELVDDGPSGVEPRLFPNVLANAAASRAAIAFGLKLFNISLAGSFPGGEGAVVFAADLLKSAGSGIALAGGVDRGAAVFALETFAGARARGARILAGLSGFEESFDSQARAARHPGCLCLADAVRKAASSGRRAAYQARGLWGGGIRLSLNPSP